VRRIPESELMESTEQARAYSCADFRESNNIFVNNLFRVSKINDKTKILDIGCGDGEIPIQILKRKNCDITAVDGSEAMLDEFYKKVKNNNIRNIKIMNSLIDDELLVDSKFDIVMSNSLVHHIKDIKSFWKNLIRLTDNNGIILCMDLQRPDDESSLINLLQIYGGNNLTLKKDFENSLRAAYTIDEIKSQLNEINKISFTIKPVSDRHFFVSIRLKDDTIFKTK
tara:strand:+ start:1005 stop:1682 length:678 start_codon:yes stop_codon:yes gene_type:complete